MPPGMRAVNNLGDPRGHAKAQALASRPGGGLGGKGILTASQKLRSPPNRTGLGSRGIGKGKASGFMRRRKIIKDNIQGVTRGDIRRLARRGGVKRIAGTIYDEVRTAMNQHLSAIMKDICAIVEYQQRKTVTVKDVIFALHRIGRPIYGFDDQADRDKAKRDLTTANRPR